MALVSVVLMLAVLLALSQILVEKVWQSTRQTAAEADREQLFWAAQSGIESARHLLAANYAASGGWQSFLSVGVARTYPANPAWTLMVNGRSVDIYLRDNADGDGDYRRDNDLKLYVLARARGRQGAEAMVESLCGFDETSPVRGSSQQGHPIAGPLVDLAAEPVSDFDITD